MTRDLALALGFALLPALGCSFGVEAPKDPIVINLNVKIEHEIRVKVDKDLDQLIEQEDGLF